MKQRLLISRSMPAHKIRPALVNAIINRITKDIEAQRPLNMSCAYIDLFWYVQARPEPKAHNAARKIILSALTNSGIIKSKDNIIGLRDHFVIHRTRRGLCIFLDDLITITDRNTNEVGPGIFEPVY
jgi:hypothetical protein